MFRRCFDLTLFTLAALAAPQRASAQTLSFTSRNGSNVAYCGQLGGPAVQHNFSTPAATADLINVSDPGNVDAPPSSASSRLDASPAQLGLSLAGSGVAMRGPLQGQGFGVSATADARDYWVFTLSAPARFSFSASLDGTSTQSSAPTVSFTFGVDGGGGQITPDPGTPAGAFSSFLVGPGSFAVSATGTLAAGSYFLQIAGRVEGTNVWPYSGTFDVSVALGLGCETPTSYCTAGTTGNGCTAAMQASGTPSASATSGFTLSAVGTEGAAPGLIFYGVSGRTAQPWGASSSLVCVKAPTQRTGIQTSSGTAGACNGTMSLDWCAFVASHPTALGAPFSAGEVVQAQCWFRDSASPKTTSLSDAIEFALCP